MGAPPGSKESDSSGFVNRTSSNACAVVDTSEGAVEVWRDRLVPEVGYQSKPKKCLDKRCVDEVRRDSIHLFDCRDDRVEIYHVV